MKKKISRSQQIPKYGTPIRSTLISYLTALPDYQEGLRKGFPLFTTKELDEIRDNYKDGLTWKDIDKILSAKGIFFKKATFRKYIQEGNISKAIGYKNTENGRVVPIPLISPPDSEGIRHPVPIEVARVFRLNPPPLVGA